MLLYSEEQYLQYLEGPDEKLVQCWGRIARDTRHDVLWRVEGTRDFALLGALPMGFFDADRERTPAASGPLWQARHDWTSDRAPALADLLGAIAHEKYPSLVPAPRCQ